MFTRDQSHMKCVKISGYSLQNMGCMPRGRLCVPSRIFLQQPMCNQQEFHFQEVYQRQKWVYSDDCSIGDRTVDRHPCCGWFPFIFCRCFNYPKNVLTIPFLVDKNEGKWIPRRVRFLWLHFRRIWNGNERRECLMSIFKFVFDEREREREMNE